MTVELSAELKRWLVTEAEAAAQRVGDKRNQASQLRNLLQISQTESEVPVLVNFIRYQAARSATAGFWGPLHRQVIGTLEAIEGQRCGDDPLLRRAAIQHYFGYLIRHYTYLTKFGGGSTSAPQGKRPGGRRQRG